MSAITFSRLQKVQVDFALVSHIEFLKGALAVAAMGGNDKWKRQVMDELAATEAALIVLRAASAKPLRKITFEKQSISPCIYVAKIEGQWFANITKGKDDAAWGIEFYSYQSLAPTLADAKAIVTLAASA